MSEGPDNLETKKGGKGVWVVIAIVAIIAIVLLLFNLPKEANQPIEQDMQAQEQKEAEIVAKAKPRPVEPTQQPPSSNTRGCGDGVCGKTETYAICPDDCIETCGDTIAQDDENWKNCQYDLLYYCGDGVCNEWEAYPYCELDCESCIIDQFNQYDGPNECPPNTRWVSLS